MLNNCNFIGRLGNDPETAFTANQKQVTKISLACGEKWKDKNTGEMKEKTEWVRVVAFGKLAEIISEYLKKGSLVYISGKMQTSKYQDKDGKDCYSTDILANEMKMLSSRAESDNSSNPQQSSSPQVTQVSAGDIDPNEDIPW